MSAGGIIAVSTLSVTSQLRKVRDKLVSKSVIATDRVFLGTQYTKQNGDGLRLVFIPTGTQPSTAPLEMSNKEGGSNQWLVTAHLWAVNSADDYGFDQFAALETLIVELQGALRLVAGGRVKFSTLDFASKTKVLKYGESAEFSFSFSTNFQMVPDTESIPAGATTTNAVVRSVS